MGWLGSAGWFFSGNLSRLQSNGIWGWCHLKDMTDTWCWLLVRSSAVSVVLSAYTWALQVHQHLWRLAATGFNKYLWEEGRHEWRGDGGREAIRSFRKKEMRKGRRGKERRESGKNGTELPFLHDRIKPILLLPNSPFPSLSSCTVTWLGSRNSSNTAYQNWSTLGRIFYNLYPKFKFEPRHISKGRTAQHFILM